MANKFIKSKAKPNSLGPGFRTPDNFRARNFGKGVQVKFNPSQFKTQHKGG